MPDQKRHLSIKSWSEEDQPREKLLKSGRKSLSNAELMAILIGSGSKGESALSLCQRILSNYNNDLYSLGKTSLKDLIKYHGIGEAKALTLIAALELGSRRKLKSDKPQKKLNSSAAVYHFIADRVHDLKVEEFWIILLNNSLVPIQVQKIATGATNMVVVDKKIIFKAAIDHLAQAIILVHNHPSGSLTPSRQDIKLTDEIAEGSKLFGIKTSDHLIISENGYYSFADEGLL